MAQDLKSTVTYILSSENITVFNKLVEIGNLLNLVKAHNAGGRFLFCVNSLLEECGAGPQLTSEIRALAVTNARDVIMSLVVNEDVPKMGRSQELAVAAIDSMTAADWGNFEALYVKLALYGTGVMRKSLLTYTITSVNWLAKRWTDINEFVGMFTDSSKMFFEIKILGEDLAVDEESTWCNHVSVLNTRMNFANGLRQDGGRDLAFASTPYTFADFVECFRQGLISKETLEYIKSLFVPLIHLVKTETRVAPVRKIPMDLLSGPLTEMLCGVNAVSAAHEYQELKRDTKTVRIREVCKSILRNIGSDQVEFSEECLRPYLRGKSVVADRRLVRLREFRRPEQ